MPFYEKKDAMHDISHIERVLKLARKIAGNYLIDKELMELGAYLHGVIHLEEGKVIDFLKGEQLSEERINEIRQVAWDSQRDKTPQLIEGKILHDAHLLEGGKTFMVAKYLVLGTANGESLEEILEFMRNQSPSYRCSLPESQDKYMEQKRYTRDFIDDLTDNL